MSSKSKSIAQTHIRWQAEGPVLGLYLIRDHFGNIIAEGIKTVETARAMAAMPALYEASTFARSVLAANPMELSEKMAIEKLDAAIALTREVSSPTAA